MNKKQLALLSNGNISYQDEGLALYASKYLEVNYNFTPNIDIIHGGDEEIDLLNIFMYYEEIIVLDVIGIEDSAGSFYQFPMDVFRNFTTDDEDGVLGCLNLMEQRGDTLPTVSLLAIIPDTIAPKVGLSDSLLKPFKSYILMIVQYIEERGFISEVKNEKQTLQSVIANFNSLT